MFNPQAHTSKWNPCSDFPKGTEAGIRPPGDGGMTLLEVRGWDRGEKGVVRVRNELCGTKEVHELLIHV